MAILVFYFFFMQSYHRVFSRVPQPNSQPAFKQKSFFKPCFAILNAFFFVPCVANVDNKKDEKKSEKRKKALFYLRLTPR